MAENTLHILIVDDDSSTRASLREMLAKRLPVARVIDVASPHEALARLEKQRFDMIVTDYELPTPAGTFMDDIARLPDEKKPFGVVVGFSQVNDIPKIGKTYFRMKPFGHSEILAVVQEVVDAKEAKEAWDKGQPKGAGTKIDTSVPAPAAPAAKKTGPVDANFINPFLEGAVVVLETVCETKSERESVFTRKEDSIRGDVSAVIAMNSSSKQGSFAISFEKKAFLAVASRMLGENYTEVNDENKDVAGEICNQVFGYAKRKLNNEMGYDIQPAIPSVITGENHQIKHLVKGIVIAAKFKTPEGWYIVEAAVSG